MLSSSCLKDFPSDNGNDGFRGFHWFFFFSLERRKKIKQKLIIIMIIIIILFSHIGLPMELPYSRKLGDNKSPQTSRTFLRILAVFRITLF